jgi:hypothetical protein
MEQWQEGRLQFYRSAILHFLSMLQSCHPAVLQCRDVHP